ncbi:CotO family spore coat protein [Bacillus salipaludis]|uniref:CotO family spore coat protein n=1 Tax=Bacillus salipaludis TaxID=2547811 RepID=UPI002E1B0700|nr:CotO family spore coat protein [Bacillus salipaludis]
MTEKKNQGPLLYIYQPFSKTPSIKMQEVYTIKQEKPLPIVENHQKGESKRNSLKEESNQEIVPIEVTMSEKKAADKKEKSDKQRYSFKKVKSFKEMNMKERLRYLVDFPKALPPVPCVFYTVNKNYQGYLQDYRGQEITIQFHDQTTKTIPVDDLKDVIMIGIKN